MVKRYDFDNDGNRLIGPDGIYVLASDYERLEAALSIMYMAAWDIANAALTGSTASGRDEHG